MRHHIRLAFVLLTLSNTCFGLLYDSSATAWSSTRLKGGIRYKFSGNFEDYVCPVKTATATRGYDSLCPYDFAGTDELQDRYCNSTDDISSSNPALVRGKYGTPAKQRIKDAISYIKEFLPCFKMDEVAGTNPSADTDIVFDIDEDNAHCEDAQGADDAARYKVGMPKNTPASGDPALPHASCYVPATIVKIGRGCLVQLTEETFPKMHYLGMATRGNTPRPLGELVHVLLHLLGFEHEHHRADRNAFVNIQLQSKTSENWIYSKDSVGVTLSAVQLALSNKAKASLEMMKTDDYNYYGTKYDVMSIMQVPFLYASKYADTRKKGSTDRVYHRNLASHCFLEPWQEGCFIKGGVTVAALPASKMSLLSYGHMRGFSESDVAGLLSWYKSKTGSTCAGTKSFPAMQCNNGGTFIGMSAEAGEVASTGFCACPEGYRGDRCEMASCYTCRGGTQMGRCVGPNTCECDGSGKGKFCEYYRESTSNSCGEGVSSKCVNIGICDGSGCHCLIQSRYEGTKCEKPTCNPACRNGGTCGVDFKCECPERFSGSICEIYDPPDRLHTTTDVSTTSTEPTTTTTPAQKPEVRDSPANSVYLRMHLLDFPFDPNFRHGNSVERQALQHFIDAGVRSFYIEALRGYLSRILVINVFPEGSDKTLADVELYFSSPLTLKERSKAALILGLTTEITANYNRLSTTRLRTDYISSMGYLESASQVCAVYRGEGTCLNLGICVALQLDTPHCKCKTSFEGELCERTIGEEKSDTVMIVVGVAVGVLILIVGIVLVACCCRKPPPKRDYWGNGQMAYVTPPSRGQHPRYELQPAGPPPPYAPPYEHNYRY